MDAVDSLQSRLLSLPPEIRNTIYRYALVQGKISVRAPAFATAEQPALLQVNRQIRTEAINIYYHENEFLWLVEDFDATATAMWQQSSEARAQASHIFEFEGRRVWDNLFKWLKAFYSDETSGIGPVRLEQGGAEVVVAASHMFEVVRELRSQGREWEHIRPILECMRKAVGAYDAPWLE